MRWVKWRPTAGRGWSLHDDHNRRVADVFEGRCSWYVHPEFGGAYGQAATVEDAKTVAKAAAEAALWARAAEGLVGP